ncbi:MAG: phosphoenolpyruvate carboxykinase (ATP) [Candidatus Dojkabacteria bacterium]
MSTYILIVFKPSGTVHTNKTANHLIKKALDKEEGRLSIGGVLSVVTGQYTGRSPFDRYIVDTKNVHDSINWSDANRPIKEEKFDAFYSKIVEYLNDIGEFFV